MKIEYERLIEPYLRDLMQEFPAVAIDGLKGVGKTVSAKRLAATVFELDRPRDYEQMVSVPDILLSEKKPSLIDEWQRVPAVWDFVRRAVDDGAEAGSYLLTGSLASKDVNIHSGAARIIRKRMYPLSIAERAIEKPTVSLGEMLVSEKPGTIKIEGKTEIATQDYIKEITVSGLPEFRRLSSENRKIAIESYFANVLTHDFLQQGVRLRQPETLFRWLRAYAAAISTDAGYTEILDASTAGESNKPAAKTTIAYREALQNLWLLSELDPWIDGEDFFHGLKRSSKHYLADPAFAAYLLGLDEKILLGAKNWPARAERFDEKYGSILGRLFEALVYLCLNTYASVNNAKLFFVRTHKGDREIDFVIEKEGQVIACEVKFTPEATTDSGKHLKWFKEKTGSACVDAMIITTGGVAYRRSDGIAVVPLALLGA
jgi:predicted AAA+ superfamily ATPase